MTTPRLSRLGFLFLVCCLLGGAYLIVRAPSNTLSRVRVTYFDVGQGDSIFIETPSGAQVLIDGGRDEKALSHLSDVMRAGDRFIDVIIATHPDADHIGGLPMILSRYDVGAVITSKVSSDTETYKTFLSQIEAHNIPLYSAWRGMKLRLDDTIPTTLTILFPDRDTTDWETNSASVVARLDAGTKSALFTGDAPVWVEQYLTTLDPQSVAIDILKLGHHGSRTSTSATLLKAATPSLAIISAGRDNSYGHPHKEVLELLKEFNIPTASTAEEGNITLETDGTKWYKK